MPVECTAWLQPSKSSVTSFSWNEATQDHFEYSDTEPSPQCLQQLFTSYFCLYFYTFETAWGTMWAKKCQEVGSSFPGRKEKKERRPWWFLAVIFQETSVAKCWPRLPTGRVVMVPGDCSQGMWARTEISWSFVSQKQGRRMGAWLKRTRLCKTIFKTSSPWDLLVMPIARVVPDASI